MYDALLQPDRLRAAWKRVRANGGATGGDGESAAMFAADLTARLDRLATDLSTGRYRPGPLRAVRLVPRDKQGENPASIRMRTRGWGLAGRA